MSQSGSHASRVGLEMSKLNLAHFMMSQTFYNLAQPTTGW